MSWQRRKARVRPSRKESGSSVLRDGGWDPGGGEAVDERGEGGVEPGDNGRREEGRGDTEPWAWLIRWVSLVVRN